jgi:hypothetical protein
LQTALDFDVLASTNEEGWGQKEACQLALAGFGGLR